MKSLTIKTIMAALLLSSMSAVLATPFSATRKYLGFASVVSMVAAVCTSLKGLPSSRSAQSSNSGDAYGTGERQANVVDAQASHHKDDSVAQAQSIDESSKSSSPTHGPTTKSSWPLIFTGISLLCGLLSLAY